MLKNMEPLHVKKERERKEKYENRRRLKKRRICEIKLVNGAKEMGYLMSHY